MWICRSFNCVRELECISKKFKGVSSKLQVYFRGVSRVFQSFFHEVTRLNRVSSPEVLKFKVMYIDTDVIGGGLLQKSAQF